MTRAELDQLRIREWNNMDPEVKNWLIANWIHERKGYGNVALIGAEWLQQLIREDQLPKGAEKWAQAAIQLQIIIDLTK